jgi:hypothetical protein
LKRINVAVWWCWGKGVIAAAVVVVTRNTYIHIHIYIYVCTRHTIYLRKVMHNGIYIQMYRTFRLCFACSRLAVRLASIFRQRELAADYRE